MNRLRNTRQVRAWRLGLGVIRRDELTPSPSLTLVSSSPTSTPDPTPNTTPLPHGLIITAIAAATVALVLGNALFFFLRRRRSIRVISVGNACISKKPDLLESAHPQPYPIPINLAALEEGGDEAGREEHLTPPPIAHSLYSVTEARCSSRSRSGSTGQVSNGSSSRQSLPLDMGESRNLYGGISSSPTQTRNPSIFAVSVPPPLLPGSSRSQAAYRHPQPAVQSGKAKRQPQPQSQPRRFPQEHTSVANLMLPSQPAMLHLASDSRSADAQSVCGVPPPPYSIR